MHLYLKAEKTIIKTIMKEVVRDFRFAFLKLTTGRFSWSDYAAHKTKTLSKIFVDFVNEMSYSNQRMLRGQNELANEIENEKCQIIESCKSSIKKSQSSESACLQINDFVNNLNTTIMNDVSKNIQEELMGHSLKDLFKQALNYIKEGELKEIIEDEFPEIQKIFGDIKNIKNYVFNVCEDIASMKENSEESLKASLKLILRTASVKDSVKSILNHIDVTLKDFLAKKTASDKIVGRKSEYNDDIDEYILQHLKNIAEAQCKSILNTYVIDPAITRAKNTIRDKGSRNIENIFRELINKKQNSNKKQDAINLYDGMDTTRYLSNLTDVPEDLIKQTMHIQSRAKNYKQFKRLMQENLPYDEICIESIHKYLEEKLNKNILIRISKNGNTHEFGDPGCKKAKVIDIKYSKEHICSILRENFPELRDCTNYEFLSNISEFTNTNKDIIKALKSFDNGYYKDFNSKDIYKNMLQSGFEYGSFDELQMEFSNERENEVVVVHVPADTAYEIFIDKV